MSFEESKIINVDIEKEIKTSFLDYSMSVIVSRALPDVRDGLKPVHRRILYTMYEAGLYPERAYKKCATSVGDVLGKYHPHGDQSVYDALVRLAQDFSMRYMLVDGHGNFGSVDGDPPAAYRYTEAKMSKISMEMLRDIEKETVDYMPNYDDSHQEPMVLPARYPNLLVNGSTGIAVGMATNIPPHNLNEIIDGLHYLIDNPDADIMELMEIIKGPDFPTAGIIMGKGAIRSAYKTGRGKITVRARTEIIEKKNGRFAIEITELPYQVNKARLIEKIASLVHEKRIEGISDLNDYSSREGMSVIIDLKRDANPQLVLNQLFTYTQMEITFGAIMLALVNGQPKVLTLKEMLEHYLRFQEEVITRRTQYELRKAKERAHILEGLKIALDHIDEVIAILRTSKDRQVGKERLKERFELSEAQAQAIVKMQLGQLTGLERSKIEEELAALLETIEELTAILADESKILDIIKEETAEIKAKFGDERRTEIMNVTSEVDLEDLIPEEASVYTLTTHGYIKRQPVDVYKLQKRGGRGVIGMKRKEEDVAETMFTGSTHEYILFFTSFGKVYRLKGYEIPEGSRTSQGINIVNLLPIEKEEKISAMIRVPQEREEEEYLCMLTKAGIIKRTALSEYSNVRKTGIIAINLDEEDELVYVALTDGKKDILVATKNGMSIRFDEEDARAIGRTARGVKAIALDDEDEVVSMTILDEDSKVLTISETGYGRISLASDYRVQLRGGRGLINYRTEKYGKVAAVCVVNDDEDIILISSDGIIIRIATKDISEFSRPAKGVRVMRIGKGDKVITLASAESEEETDEDITEEIEEEIQA